MVRSDQMRCVILIFAACILPRANIRIEKNRSASGLKAAFFTHAIILIEFNATGLKGTVELHVFYFFAARV